MNNMSTTTLRAYVVGDNRLGQAGVGGEEFLTVPMELASVSAEDIRRICSNGLQTFVILQNGVVLTAGENDQGELCRPGKRSIFQRVDMLETFRISDVSAGEGFFHLLSQSGQVLSYGKNDMGQLGNGARENKEKPRVNSNIKDSIIQIACGQHHTVALSKSGKVMTWGGNRKGQLGDGQLTSSTQPILLAQLRHRPVVAVTCGESHTAVLTSGGNVFTWGSNEQGQLGHGDTTARLRPELVRALRSNKATQVSCGRLHTLFLASNALLFAAGANSHGQCGLELEFRQVLTPTVVEFFREKKVVDIVCGALHSFVLVQRNNQRKLYVIGANTCGQLGLGSIQRTEYPVLSAWDAEQIEAIFASPLSLTSYVLTYEPLHQSTNPSSLTVSGSPLPAVNRMRRSRVRQLPALTLSDVQQLVALLPQQPSTLSASALEQIILQIREAVSAAFSSISVLNASFLRENYLSNLHGQLCVDLAAVRHAYALLMATEARHPSIVVTLGRALIHLCEELRHCPFDDAENLSVFFIVLENPLLLRVSDFHIALETLVKSILSLPKTYRLLLFKWMTSYPSEYFGRVVTVLQRFLSFAKTTRRVNLDITPPILVLETLFQCNQSMDELILPHHYFNNAELSGDLGQLLQEWDRWQEARAQSLSQVFNYWQYPFLISDHQKYEILQIEYNRVRRRYAQWLSARYSLTTQLERQSRVRELQWQGLPPGLHLIVERTVIGTPPVTNNTMSSPLPPTAPSPSTSPHSAAHNQSAADQVTVEDVVDEHDTQPSSTTTAAEDTAARRRSAEDVLVSMNYRPVWLVQVRRETVADDLRRIVTEIWSHDQDVLFQPLKVEFEGEVGQDLGGLTKELLTIAAKHILQQTPAFRVSHSGQVYWFTNHELLHESGSSSETSQKRRRQDDDDHAVSWEFLLGLVQGLAVFHGIHLDVPLPRALYKLLLSDQRPLTLSDLYQADADLARGLKQLLTLPEGSGSVEDILAVSFSASVNPLLSEPASVPLIPRGDSIPVTRGNAADFVQRMVRHALYESCRGAIDQYVSGLRLLLGKDIWQICGAEEIEHIVAGTSLSDASLVELRPGAVYRGQFHADHPVVRWFWEVLEELTDIQQKRQFLLFVTGSDRAPLTGLSQLHLVLDGTEQEPSALPSAHTCFTHLCLSRHYPDKETVRMKLLQAMEHCEGFGLV